MGDETVRFTVELDAEVVEALDEHCVTQSNRASSVVGTTVRIGRSKVLDAMIRKALKLPPATPIGG